MRCITLKSRAADRPRSVRLFAAALFSALFLFSCNGLASEPVENDGAPTPRWLVDVGVGFRAGGCFLSSPTNGRKFIDGAALGAELVWGVFALEPHRVTLGAGFLWLSPERESGTAAMRVETEYTRFDFTAGYDFTWRLLVAGAHVGLGLGVNRVKTSYGQPGWEVIENEIVYHEPEDPEVRERVGSDPGFLAGLSIGVELGELWGVPDLIEIRAKSDYLLRGARNEFTAMAAVVFWLTAFTRRDR